LKFSSTTLRLAAVVILIIIFLSPILIGIAYAHNNRPSSLNPANLLQRSIPSAITPWKPRPVLGPQRTLILPVQFQDVRFRSSIADIRALVDHVDNWFRKSSYGRMYINYTIYEQVIKLPKTMSSYGAPAAGMQLGDDPSRADAYIVDTLNTIITKTNVDLSSYQHVVLMHAGGDEANTDNPNEIWSYCDCVGPIAEEDPRKEASWVLYDESGKITHAFWGISTFSEDEHWAVFVHEFSHSLGVSDLYVYGTDGYSEAPGIGFWSNMATGSVLDPPVDIDGWSKYILGWIEATTVESPQGEYTIHTLDSSNDPKALLVKINGSEDEYYFVHARQKVGTDAALPSEGVIVFKINRWRERSLSGEELAIIDDANPATPSECDSYSGMARELCWPLDAPYNTGREYSFSYYDLSANLVLNDDGFWDGIAGIAFKVQPIDAGSFKIIFGASPEAVGITTTTGTKTDQGTRSCIIATAAFGSEMAPEVLYMRFVRDRMIGSTQIGGILVNAFNTFYYSWSPVVAELIAKSWAMRAIFRVLLVPLTWVVHGTGMLFTATANLTGSLELASLLSFLVAASASIVCYVLLPSLFFVRLARTISRRRNRIRSGARVRLSPGWLRHKDD
jgi:M6 family metalloprotease-like protein